MEPNCVSLPEALQELEKIAPGAPLLALGQTVLWDEPVKAGAALALKSLGSNRKFVAGVHDTDYFAKLPHGNREAHAYRAIAHNDHSTKGLWSAAGEFSSLFGGETVISKHDYQAAGASLEKLARSRPELLDEATEAFGWRGIVSLDQEPSLSAEVPLDRLFATLRSTLDWAVQSTLDQIAGEGKARSIEKSQELWKIFCKSYEAAECGTLADFYCDLVPSMYEFAAGEPVDVDVRRTSELLRFNSETCGLPRFRLLSLFVDPKTRRDAELAYNDAVTGSEVYPLDRFGTGAIPFELLVPGHGRGTLRIGNRGLIVSGDKPLFASYKKPITSIEELARVIENRFGPNCVLIGKAISLIGMLATEFVFVFHEGASSYVKATRKFHSKLEEVGCGLSWNPILRIKLCPWSALDKVDSWFHLPKPLQAAFGAEEICAHSLAARWTTVAQEQGVLLAELGELRRPVDLIRFLDQHVGGAWNSLAKDYEGIRSQIKGALDKIREQRDVRRELYDELRNQKRERREAEIEMGQHFRERIFEREPSSLDLEVREKHRERVASAISKIGEIRRSIGASVRKQSEIDKSSDLLLAHDRRRAAELEAELKRIQLIRDAHISSRGMLRSGYRPSSWWFPLVSPDGTWIRQTWEHSNCYFEALTL